MVVYLAPNAAKNFEGYYGEIPVVWDGEKFVMQEEERKTRDAESRGKARLFLLAAIDHPRRNLISGRA